MEVDILFADADETLRDVYHNYFSRKGFSMKTVANKWECVEQLISCRPFFLIVDVGLLNNSSECSRLSGAEAFKDIPVVIVTGDDLPCCLAEQTGVPEASCFRKPYSFVTLLKCMCDRAASATESRKRSIKSLANLVSHGAGQNVEKPPGVSMG